MQIRVQQRIFLFVSVEDKLHWTFKLYDVDGSGEIDPDEMDQESWDDFLKTKFLIFVQIFTKLCQIASGTESDQVKKTRKRLEAKKVVLL